MGGVGFKPKTKYAPVEKPERKRTLVNNYYYGVKSYQDNTA